jgi:hypothetical protein
MEGKMQACRVGLESETIVLRCIHLEDVYLVYCIGVNILVKLLIQLFFRKKKLTAQSAGEGDIGNSCHIHISYRRFIITVFDLRSCGAVHNSDKKYTMF